MNQWFPVSTPATARKLRTSALFLSIAFLVVFIGGCGNKGDLYLDEVGLSEEQRQLLDELDESSVVPTDEPTDESTDEPTDESVDTTTTDEDAKKKKDSNAEPEQ